MLPGAIATPPTNWRAKVINGRMGLILKRLRGPSFLRTDGKLNSRIVELALQSSNGRQQVSPQSCLVYAATSPQL